MGGRGSCAWVGGVAWLLLAVRPAVRAVLIQPVLIPPVLIITLIRNQVDSHGRPGQHAPGGEVACEEGESGGDEEEVVYGSGLLCVCVCVCVCGVVPGCPGAGVQFVYLGQTASNRSAADWP